MWMFAWGRYLKQLSSCERYLLWRERRALIDSGIERDRAASKTCFPLKGELRSKVLALQHIPCEIPGTIQDCLKSSGIVMEYIPTFKGQSIPRELGDFTGLTVMGGPMGVYDYDRYSFLLEDKPVLGIGLGSQLLAASLGAEVRKGKKKEIGWLGVKLTEAAAQNPL